MSPAGWAGTGGGCPPLIPCENAEAQGLQSNTFWNKHLCQYLRSLFNLQASGHGVSGRQVSHGQLEK